MLAYKNLEGHGHELLDFHVPTKAFFNLLVLISEGFEGGGPSLVT
jgi:hypothetical protein